MAFDQDRKEFRIVNGSRVTGRNTFDADESCLPMQFEEAECLAYRIALRVLSKIEDPFASALKEVRVRELLSA